MSSENLPAMKIKTSLNHPLIKAIKKWKKDQAIVSLTLEEMKKESAGRDLIIEQKVDGQSAILEYIEPDILRFGSLGGVIYSDLPVLDEIKTIFGAKNIHQAKMVGEMVGYDKKIIPFNESQSLTKNPKSDKTKVHWFPYQILELNNEKIKDDFSSYKDEWPEIIRIFKSSNYVHPVEYYEGKTEKIDQAWKKIVEKDNNEGIVVRSSNNKVYKVKPLFSYDLVVIAVGDKKGKNWPKRMIGTTLMAFMDNNKVFRTAGEIGTGWTDKEKKELFSWAQKNKVGEDDTYVWVKPQKIFEVNWERTTIKEMPSYKYSQGKYDKVDKQISGTIVKPRFIRYRTDKSVTPSDLRLTQIPNWNKKKKMARSIVATFLNRTSFLAPYGYESLLKIRRPELLGQSYPKQKGTQEPLKPGDEVEVYENGKWVKIIWPEPEKS